MIDAQSFSSGSAWGMDALSKVEIPRRASRRIDAQIPIQEI